MIPVRRGDEPDELRKVRYWRRARVLYAFHLDSSYRPTDAELVDYGSAKAFLGAKQHFKCAYCEGQSGEGEVEHFRPKSIYWWLTWSYDNLVLSCKDCNGPGYKGSKFELFDETARLQPGMMPPAQEQPKLLDPADPAVNPVDCIQFKQILGRWQPEAREGNKRGYETIRALGLASRASLIDYYQTHIKNLSDRVRGVHEAMRGQDAALVRNRWHALVSNAFFEKQPFHGLSYDYLANEFPFALRNQWGIDLRKPGEGLPHDPPMREQQNPAHTSLDPVLKLQVCALGEHPTSEKRDEAIVRLCEACPRTVGEIAGILGRETRTIESVLRNLVSARRLERDGERYRAVALQAPP